MNHIDSRSVAIGYNTSHYAVLFRRNLIGALITEGYRVHVLAPKDAYSEKLVEMGALHVDVPMDMGTNPVRDLQLLWRMRRALKSIRPAAYLGYTAKPNIYGSIAAHTLGIPTVNNIAGLGSTFITRSWLTPVMSELYRFSLSRSAQIFFQNEDDCKLFVDSGIAKKGVSEVIPGSGVDLRHFEYCPRNGLGTTSRTSFLLVARMLWDKGVREYVEAAKLLKSRYPNLTFQLLGQLDVQNPAAISRDQMNEWTAEGVIEYLGVTDDVRPFIKKSTCVVLPSYREGTSRTLLEAAAMGRPIVTTDTPGCKEVVEHGRTGYLCRVKDISDLAEKMEVIVRSSDSQLEEMGRLARAKIEREYDERLVITKYLTALSRLTPEVHTSTSANAK